MSGPPPSVVVLAGPNGAGKTTASRSVLAGIAQVTEFVNADVIAQGLSGFSPERVAIEAARVMLERLQELADDRVNFAFETTLASRTFAPWIRKLLSDEYQFHLLFLWVPSAEFSIARVEQRVRMGGHYVDPDTIRRRYERGLYNFFELYRPLTTRWFMYNNTRSPAEELIASGHGTMESEIVDDVVWRELVRRYAPKTRQ